MTTKFADFDAVEAVRRLGPARIFLRRREPALRNVLRAMLPADCYRLVEVADAALLLREVSGALLAWERGHVVELTVADRESPSGRCDILVGCRRPSWNPGVLLLTALARTPDGDETEYGSALVLGPGVSISLVKPDLGPRRPAFAGRVPLAS